MPRYEAEDGNSLPIIDEKESLTTEKKGDIHKKREKEEVLG